VSDVALHELEDLIRDHVYFLHFICLRNQLSSVEVFKPVERLYVLSVWVVFATMQEGERFCINFLLDQSWVFSIDLV